MNEQTPPTIGTRRAPIGDVLAGILLAAFVVIVVMLVTDKNLQSDFGALASVPPYYIHWYGTLALGVITLVVAALVLLTNRVLPNRSRSPRVQRTGILGGFVWSILAVVAMVAVLGTYQQVGFNSVNDFAQYLFGVTPYSDVESYIPWLYDLLLGVYVAGVIVGAIAVAYLRPKPQTGNPA